MVNIEAWNKARKQKKITLDDLAKQTAISISTIKDIFRGKTENPRIDTVQAIERALGISMEQPAEKVNSNAEDRPVALSQEDKEILEIFSEIKRIKGEAYCKILIIILRGIIENK